MDTDQFTRAVSCAAFDLLKTGVDPASVRIRIVRTRVRPDEPPSKTEYHVVASGSRRVSEQVIADVY